MKRRNGGYLNWGTCNWVPAGWWRSLLVASLLASLVATAGDRWRILNWLASLVVVSTVSTGGRCWRLLLLAPAGVACRYICR